MLISILLLVLLIAVGSYVLWSKHVWSQYTPAYTAWHTSLKSDAGEVLALPTTNIKERTAVNVQLKALANRIGVEQEKACAVNPLVQWQSQFVRALKEARDACRAVTADVMTFHRQLLLVTAYNDDDQELAKILGAVPQAGELKEEAWSSQSAAWQASVESAKGMSVSEAFKPTQQRSVEKLTAVQVAWEGLNAAHQAKDKAKYTTALATLGASYDGMSEITVATEARITELAGMLQGSYQKAFK